ncbi:MAG: glutathione S-transferase family protein [Pseudomonadota bacterium]
MAEFTFYTVPQTRGQMARWALHEVAADYDQVIFEFASRPDELAQVNPMNKVPTLVHHSEAGDLVLTETPAIAHYLAETHPQKGLLPQGPEKAPYFRWLFFASGPIEQAIICGVMNWQAPEERAGMLGFGSVERALGAIAGWLANHDFVAGDRFTMADVYVGSQLGFGLQFGTIPEEPAIRAYVDRVHERVACSEARAIDAKLKEDAANG